MIDHPDEARDRPIPSVRLPGTVRSAGGGDGRTAEVATTGVADTDASTDTSTHTLRRAVGLMMASSLLVPLAGVLTQPILAQALGVEGRGALAAALAPAILAVSVATLGLPDALVYYLAKHPSLTRRALLWASSVSTLLGIGCLMATMASLPFLSAGDPWLADLILLAMALVVPGLVVGVMRAAATGRQMWARVATERIINTCLRVVLFLTLWLTGHLTVTAAVLVSMLAPVLCGVVYWRLLLAAPPYVGEPVLDGRIGPVLTSFGSRVWLGAVAEMLLSRLGQMLMTPLAGVVELGLYSVAVTISDLPLIVAIAIQNTLFGINSRSRDAGTLTAVTRLTVLVALLGCLFLGGSLPFWIGPLFGAEFTAAILPALMLMGSAVICIPGLMAASAISAWGRPGLRSIGLAVTLVTNLVVFVVVVPGLGAVGGAITSIVSNVVMTTYMLLIARRVVGVPVSHFLLPRSADVRRLWSELIRLMRKMGAALPRRDI